MTTALLIQLITVSALIEGVPPDVALSIAKVESNYNMSATGLLNEIGAFQILPSSSKYSVQELRSPLINIKEGLRLLKLAKAKCKHQIDRTYVICFNTGVNGAKKIKYPKLFAYYKKFILARDKIKKNNTHTSFVYADHH